jgi:hypothetical protein
VRAAVFGSASRSVWQFAAVHGSAAVCGGSPHGSVRAVRAIWCVAVRLVVFGSVRGSVRQCPAVRVAVYSSVCGSLREVYVRQCASVCGSVWQCVWLCAAVDAHGSVRQWMTACDSARGSVRQWMCGSVWQCARPCVGVRAAVCGSADGSVRAYGARNSYIYV